MESSSREYDLAIVGAGVCGLYAGITAARRGLKVVVFEREERVGGLAAGFRFGESFCDFGVHMLHAFNREIFEDCAEMMGDERIEVALDARIQWGNTLCRYPLKFGDMLRAMPVWTLARCVTGLLLAELESAVGGKKKDDAVSAEDALVAFYGAPLYEFFFEEFTHRYWGIHPRELSAEFIRRKMPRLSAVDFVRKLLPRFARKKKDRLVESALDQETLHYSRSGSETLARSLGRTFEALGGVLRTGVNLSRIGRLGEGFVLEAVGERWGAGRVLNSAPLGRFFEIVDFVSPEVAEAAGSLKYKPTVVEALLVRREKCMEGLYTYYRNRVFHRVGEPKNAGMRVRPEGCSVLIVEATCEMGDEKWAGSEQYMAKVLDDLEKEGICWRGEVVDRIHLRNAYGYPVFDLGFEVNLEIVRNWFNKEEKLVSTGRQGGFTYPAMHTAMQMGKDGVVDLFGHE